MSQLSFSPGREAVVFAGQSAVTMSSREIAELCEKQHKHVMRDIKTMLEQLGESEEGYAQTWTNPQNGQVYPEYRLPKDLTLTLVAGYNVVLRKRIIDRWLELEEALAGHRTALPDLSDPVVLVQLLTEHATKRIEAEQRAASAEAKASELAPKAEAFDILDASEGSVNVRVAAKMLESPERKFIGWLQANSWAYRQNGIGPLQAYVDKRNAGYLEHRAHTFYDQTRAEHRTVVQMMITPKGLARLAQIFAKQGVPA